MRFDHTSIKRKKYLDSIGVTFLSYGLPHAMFYFGVKSSMSKGHVIDSGYQPIDRERLTFLGVGW